MNNNNDRQLVRLILETPLDARRKWSLQGFGMLRLYLTPEVRLHVWDSRFTAKPTPSMIHDHPWDFESHVVAGALTNVRYAEMSYAPSHKKITIKCGPGGCQLSEPAGVYLYRASTQRLAEGADYWQKASEIHETIPEDGTVTIVTRFFKRDTSREEANVFYTTSDWVSAEPRPATPEEVTTICAYSLERWF